MEKRFELNRNNALIIGKALGDLIVEDISEYFVPSETMKLERLSKRG